MNRGGFKHRAVLPRFRDAFGGLWLAYREEPNLRFHLFAAACVTVAGRAVSLQGWEIAYLSVTITLVLFAEMTNTAVERAVDLAADGRRHPLAAVAKEVAAGGVLLTALHAACAAAFLFLIERSAWESLSALATLAGREPWWLALPIAAGLLALYPGGHGPKRRGGIDR